MEEECFCGHLKSSHSSSLGGLVEGHGACDFTQCVCEKFTWKRYLSEDEEYTRRNAK